MATKKLLLVSLLLVVGCAAFGDSYKRMQAPQRPAEFSSVEEMERYIMQLNEYLLWSNMPRCLSRMFQNFQNYYHF